MRQDAMSPDRLPSGKRKGPGPTIAKDVNRMRIYREVKKRRTTTRVELSRLLDLNKSTVNAVVDEWQQAGFIRDAGQAEAGGAGRRPVVIEFVPDNRLAAGFQASSDRLHGVLTNLYAEPLVRISEPLVRNTPEALAEAIAGALGSLERQYGRSGVIGVGIGVPGVLSEDRSRVVRSSHLGWEDVPLRQLVEEALRKQARDCPVAMDNSVKMASLGELWHGQGHAADPFVYCNFGIGVGCGLIVGGAIVRGASNTAGELGHFAVDPAGLVCRCGRRGCLETVVGIPAIERAIGAPAAARLLSGDAAAAEQYRHVLERIGGAIGTALGALVNFLNPGLIVCDGPLMQLSGELFPHIRRALDGCSDRTSAEAVRIVRSGLYPYAGSLGAAATVIELKERQMEAPL